MSDHLGLFGRPEGETGELDVQELRAALAGSPDDPDPHETAAPHKAVAVEDPAKASRRHRRWLVVARW